MSVKKRDALGEKLREEGLAATPAFSVELHRRVMGALREKGLEVQPAEDSRRSAAWRLVRVAVPVGIAAAVAVVAWTALRPAGSAKVDQPQVVVMPSVMPREFVEPVHETVTAPTTEAWQAGKYGYLDKDARKLMVFVASQIPAVPEGQAGR